LVHGDLTSLDILKVGQETPVSSLKASGANRYRKSSAEETSKITGGKVDVLIANAAMNSTVFAPIAVQ